MEGMPNQLPDAFVFGSGDRNHGDAQHVLHLINLDGAAVAPDFVHHVQGQHHGHVQLHQLHGQVEVPLYIGGVHDVDDALGMFPQNELPGDDFLAGIGGHGIDAREVGDQGIAVPSDDAVLPVHGDAGEIAHMLVGARELVEEGSLAAVLVPGQGEGQRGVFGQRIFAFFCVIFPAFSQTGVGFGLCLWGFGVRGNFRRVVAHLADGDFLGVRHPQGQFIAVEHELHGIPQRGVFYQGDVCVRNDSHVQEMLPQRPFAAHSLDGGPFSDW